MKLTCAHILASGYAEKVMLTGEVGHQNSHTGSLDYSVPNTGGHGWDTKFRLDYLTRQFLETSAYKELMYGGDFHLMR